MAAQNSNCRPPRVMLNQLEAWTSNALDAGGEQACGLQASEQGLIQPRLRCQNLLSRLSIVSDPPWPLSGELVCSFQGLKWEHRRPGPRAA